MTIAVTGYDLEDGTRRTSDCALHRAFARVMPSGAWFWVTKNELLVAAGRGYLRRFPLPAHVASWLSDYDAGFPVAPISFHLSPY